MKNYSKTTLLLCAFILANRVNAQTYLHTDRSVYASSDTVWFSSYTLADTISQTLYVELVEKNKKVGECIFSLNKGYCSGFWPLGDTLSRGSYRLRAYTYSGATRQLYASQSLWISSKGTHLVKAPPLTTDWQISLFPEGGNMVPGLPASVVVKVTDTEKQPIETNGYLENKQQDKVATFKTDKQGFGKIYFTPKVSEKYNVVVIYPDTGQVKLPLESNDNISAVLQIDGVSDSSYIRGRIFRNLANPNSAKLVLLGYVEDSLCVALSDSSLRPVWAIKLPKNQLPKGYVRFELFDQQNQRIAERLVEGHKPESCEMTLKSIVTRKDIVEIAFQGKNNQSIAGQYSVSIIDPIHDTYLESKNEPLTDNYLVSVSPKSSKSQVLNEIGLILEGYTTNVNGKIKPNKNLLLVESKSKDVINIQSDANGYFKLIVANQPDSVSLLLQQLDSKNRIEATHIRWLPHPSPNWKEEGGFNRLAIKYINTISKNDTLLLEGKTLATVEVKGVRLVEREGVVSDYVIPIDAKLMDNSRASSALALINYMMMTDGRFIRFYRGLQPSVGGGDPLNATINAEVLIDNTHNGQTTTRTLLSILPIEDVESIEIVRGIKGTIKGIQIRNGRYGFPPTISVITRSGPYGKGQYSYPSQVSKLKMKAYTNVPAFKNSPNSTTLHWIPSLKNDSPEELKIRLKIPKDTKKILVNIKGISENNSFVNWNSEIEVNN